MGLGLNIKAFEPPAHRAIASLVWLAWMQNQLARNVNDTESDIQIIECKIKLFIWYL